MKDSIAEQTDSIDSLVAEVADAFLDELSRGRRPDVEDYARRHPEIAAVLRQVLPALNVMRRSGSDEQPAAVAGSLPESGRLGDFRLLRQIGRGGMGVVYEAEQISLDRQVALKVLPFAAVLDERQLKRFKNEARAAASLDHPNIVHVYSVGCERGVHYYAMQYVEGQTLADVIGQLGPGGRGPGGRGQGSGDEGAGGGPGVAGAKRSGAPDSAAIEPAIDPAIDPAAETVRQPQAAISTHGSATTAEFFRTVAELGIQAARALEHAHGMGVVHRDIKPSNLMIDAAGHLWITDFGLAMVETGPNLTMTGDVLGTLRYMSPEQAEARHGVLDHRTDVYSLGLTLYELLTLRPAFGGDDRQTLFRQIAEAEPRRPRQINAAIPKDLETIVTKAMAKEPQSRYATAAELADDLQRFLDNKPIRARQPSLVERGRKWTRRHRAVVWWAVSLLVTAVVGLAVSTVLIVREQAQTEQALAESRNNYRRAEQNLKLALEAVDQIYLEFVDERSPTFRVDGADRREPITPEGEKFLRKAMTFYERFARANQHDPLVRHEAAKAYVRVGNIRRELKMYHEAVAVCSQAIHIAEQLVAESPKVTEYRETLAAAYRTRGDCYQESGELDKSITDLSEAIRLQPEFVNAYMIRCVTYKLNGDLQKAIADCNKALELKPKHGLAFANRGSAHQQIGNLDQAIADVNEAIRLSPRDAGFYATRGGVYARKGEYNKAFDDYSEAIRLNPKRALLYNNRGVAYSEAREYDKAISDFNKALELDPGYAHAYNERGIVYCKQKEYDLALVDYNKALELDPDYAVAYNRRGEVYRKQKEYDLALADYNKALELDPGYAIAYNNRGIVYLEQKEFDLALADYNKALELDPDLASAYSNRGLVYIEQKEYDLALADYNKALELDADFGHAYNGRAMVYFDQNKYDLALADYNKALTLEPDCANYYSNRGYLYCAQKAYDLALQDFNKALKLGHDTAEVYNGRGLVYAGQKRYDLALDDYNKALELKPDYVKCYSNRGYVYGMQKEYDRALQDFNKALTQEPDHAAHYCNRGQIYFLQNRYDLALADCNKAMELDPNNFMMHQSRGRVYCNQKEYDLALADYNKALELDADYADAYGDRGSVYCMQKQYDLGLADYNKALELDRDTDNLRHNLALFLLNCPDPQFRDTARALELAKEAVKASPQDAGASSVLGQAHYRGGDYQEAVEALARSIELDYLRKARSWFFLAMAHSKLGHEEQAHEYYQQAVEWMAENPSPGAAFPISQFRTEAAEVVGIEGE